jgi:hypothetical protein
VVLEVVVVVATKEKSDIHHPSFGNRWNEKKTMMMSLVFIMVVLDATTQEKKTKMTNMVLALNCFWKY